MSAENTHADEKGVPADGVIHRVENSNGHGMNAFRFDNIYLFPLPEVILGGRKQIDLLKGLKDVQLDKDDVLICAYPKCGTHWVWEMIEMLKSGKLEHQKEGKETRMLEFIFRDRAESIPAPRCLNTHLPLRMLPKDIEKKKVKIIHVMRNPKDTCVSFFNHASKVNASEQYSGNFVEFTNSFLMGKTMFGGYSDYLLNFEKERKLTQAVPVLYFFYEDMKKNPVGAVKQLSVFLDLSVTDEFCQEVAEACSFKKMKKMDEQIRQKELFQFWKEGSGGTFYRKGEIGDWKNWFTVAESEKFDLIWKESMNESGIKFDYS